MIGLKQQHHCKHGLLPLPVAPFRIHYGAGCTKFLFGMAPYRGSRAREALPTETGSKQIGRAYGAPRQSSTLPTDSSLLGDGDRVLTRLMKKVTAIVGAAGTKLRNRMRSVQRRVAEIARASRAKGDQGQQKLDPLYRKLLGITGRVMGQAKRFSSEIASGTKRSSDVLKQAALAGLKREIDGMVET